ncbi:UDP-N-acetylglucosamine transferase subunit [Rhodotorula toruloides]
MLSPLDWRSVLLLIVLIVLLVAVTAARLLLVVLRTHSRSRRPHRRQTDEASLAVFLGSGGHTAEMMRLVAHLDWRRFSRRTWVISSGDLLSEAKALALEKKIGTGEFRILRIPRARRVHQSYLTSPFTTLYSLAYCLWHIAVASPLDGRQRRIFADVVLLNGPGSCVPITCAAFLPRLLSLPSPALIYVESLARTRRLSLSAKLVRPFVDRFFVQWDSLRDELVKKEEAKGVGRWRLKARVECQGWLV